MLSHKPFITLYIKSAISLNSSSLKPLVVQAGVPNLMPEVMKVAHRISELSRPAIMMAKESVNKSYEMSLAEGIKFERRLFHSTFATDDQKEGMAAFSEKREPNFKNR